MPFCSISFSRGRTSWCESEASRALGQYDGITVVSQGTRTAVAGGDCARAQPPVHGGAAEAGEFPKRENRYKHTQVYRFLASQPSSGCPIHTEPAGGYTASATHHPEEWSCREAADGNSRVARRPLWYTQLGVLEHPLTRTSPRRGSRVV